MPLDALSDAGRAWRITPQFSAKCEYEIGQGGERRLKSRRSYTVAERAVHKVRAASQVIARGLEVRLAPEIRIRRIDDEGLMANLLHVLEVLHRMRPDAHVYVDWTLTGEERGFRYGCVGDNVWTGLFRQLGQLPGPQSLCAEDVVDFTLWGTGKEHLIGPALCAHRRAYHRTLAGRVEVVNERVRDAVRETREGGLRGRFAVAVHRRVSNPMVRNLQRDGTAHTVDRFIEDVYRVVPEGTEDWAVFLATDDATVVAPFKEAFGERLVVREGVQRTTANDTEVHFRDWNQLSLADAEDVLIDMLLLASCDVLLHASSSISTMAGLWNPDLRLVRVGSAA